MAIPDWADEKLSLELPVLRARGEGQNLEYIESFPEQAREIGKEIAAFATSNPGMILLGVTDSGDLKGLDQMEPMQERDRVLRRLEGICRGTVKPSITPSLNFAIENGKVVLVIAVPKGSQPIYYSQNVAYVRHITESRPADPHEVIELIAQWLSSRVGSEKGTTKEDTFLSGLASVLINLLIYGEEVESRNINPWLDLLMAEFGNSASSLRRLASTDLGNELGLADEMEQLAQEADQVSSYRHRMGRQSWEAFLNLVQTALEHAKRIIKDSRIDTVPVSEAVFNQLINTVTESKRFLCSLSERVTQIAENGRISEVQEQASQIGYRLLKLSYYSLNEVPSNMRQELRAVGKDLHIIETVRRRVDGGLSTRKIQEGIAAASQDLENITNQIQLRNSAK